MDFLRVAIAKKRNKARAGALVLRVHGDSLRRWEVQAEQERRREEEAWMRRVAAIQAQVLEEERQLEEEVWLRFVWRVQLELWAREAWVNRWQ